MKKTTIFCALFAGVFSANAELIDFTLSVTGAGFYYRTAQAFNSLGTETSLALYDSDGDFLSDSLDPDDVGTSYADDITMKYAVLADSKINDGGNWSDGNFDINIEDDTYGDATFGDPNFADPIAAITVIMEDNLPGISYTDANYMVDFQFVLEEEIMGIGSYGIIEEYSFFDVFTEAGIPAWGLGLDPNFDVDSFIDITEQGVNLRVGGGFSGTVFAQDLPWLEVLDDGDLTISLSGNFPPPTIWDDSVILPVTVDITGKAITEVPEPAMLGIFGLVLTGIGIMQRHRRKLNS